MGERPRRHCTTAASQSANSPNRENKTAGQTSQSAFCFDWSASLVCSGCTLPAGRDSVMLSTLLNLVICKIRAQGLLSTARMLHESSIYAPSFYVFVRFFSG